MPPSAAAIMEMIYIAPIGSIRLPRLAFTLPDHGDPG
jgi:hypothetical protein